MPDLDRFVFVDIETTGLEETSGIYQMSMVITDTRFKVKNVVNDFLLLDKSEWDSGYRVPFGYEGLIEKSNGLSLRDKWDDYHELLWDKGSLVVSYNTSFDLRMINLYSKRNNLLQPNWGTEIYSIDKFVNRGNFCAMKAVGRHSGFGHNIKLGQAVQQFIPSLYSNQAEEFDKFCRENNIVGKGEYHDGLFDSWCLYCLMKGNKSWMF